ncbi:ribokinase [Oricola cellulosilytica]|uniref:Ribokinase n=1 Tax=Oricola cellulosilytica TaxID=1429082 RepID=A0A4R0PBV7_9HYPH|nr:ribokinase [Oricola cellulosilytica]TCD12427.1 ribokinase [Oricola cellulosilytica]
MTGRNAVLVVGSLHLDFIVDAPRLPRRDETVMGSGVAIICGGKGGNQAAAARRHGARTYMAGRVATDFFGDRLLENLTRWDVDVSLMQKAKSGASGMSVAIVEETGDYGAVVVSGANREVEAAGLAVPVDAAVLVLQNEIPEAANFAAAKAASAVGATVILNAAPTRPLSSDLLALVDVLIVNRIEAEELFGCEIRTPTEAAEASERQSAGPDNVVITLGGEGLVYRRAGSSPAHMPSFEVEVASTHGAGDAFTGALAARIATGNSIEKAIRYAMAAAALHVSATTEQRDKISPNHVLELLERGRSRSGCV